MIIKGKKRRLTIIECGNDMNMMIDMAKVADLVGLNYVYISAYEIKPKKCSSAF